MCHGDTTAGEAAPLAWQQGAEGHGLPQGKGCRGQPSNVPTLGPAAFADGRGQPGHGVTFHSRSSPDRTVLSGTNSWHLMILLRLLIHIYVTSTWPGSICTRRDVFGASVGSCCVWMASQPPPHPDMWGPVRQVCCCIMGIVLPCSSARVWQTVSVKARE